MSNGFWDRLAARVRPTETLKTIEDSTTIVRAFTATMSNALVQFAIGAALFVWFHETGVAWTQVAMGITFVVAWVWFATTGSVFGAMSIAVVGATTLTIYGHVLLGGYAYSGAYLLFGVSLTTGVAVVMGKRPAILTGVTFAVAGLVLGFLEQTLRASRQPPDPTLTSILFVGVLIGSMIIVVPLVLYFMGRLNAERERAEALLLNVLPAEVATELKEHGHTTARHYESLSVLFADIVGFTPMSAAMEPDEMVERLNDVFTHFDTLADRYQVEKIRTIGDNYMVAAGVPTPRDDHASALALMAMDMLAYDEAGPLSFRIGINSGPAVAGVIGTKKFQYDVWGDTVNTASRMESHGEPGRIQISDATNRLIKDSFTTRRRGSIEVKGKGTLTTWWLEGRQDRVTAGKSDST